VVYFYRFLHIPSPISELQNLKLM